MTKRVGIFSGTFDPVHSGHIQFAKSAIVRCGLDKVFFLVEPRPRRKQGVKALEHRLAMVRLAVKDEPALGTIILEQDRFTPHETMPLLKARFVDAELHMLMGDDMLLHLGDWPHVDTLLKNSRFIVGVRTDEEAARNRLHTIERTRGLKFDHLIFKSAQPQVSSSKIRAGLRKGELPEAVPVAVQKYIRRHGLYSPTDE